MTIDEIKKSIVQAGIRLVDSGLISRTWGNISCRIDENTMAISPSGRDYLSLMAEEIVEVKLSDCSYSGKIKPSVEKGIHASVYMLYPETNFVIHTHQVNASVVGALGLKSVKIEGDYPSLGGEVLCAEYAIPGTKLLCKHVTECLKRSKGNAVIMVYHGALCFGKNQDEAFNTATQLEKACDEFVEQHYMNISGEASFSWDRIRRFALVRAYGEYENEVSKNILQYDSVRTQSGFMLLKAGGYSKEVIFDNSLKDMPEDAKIHNDIYRKHKDVNYIKYLDAPTTREVSSIGIDLRPLLDDFAQIVGTLMQTVDRDGSQISAGLKKQSAVFVRNEGALCLGSTRDDAASVAMIVEKTCKTLVGAALFNHIKPINRLECYLMRLNYIINYSKAKKQ